MSYLSLHPQSLTQGLSQNCHLTSIGQIIMNSSTSRNHLLCLAKSNRVFLCKQIYIPNCFLVVCLILKVTRKHDAFRKHVSMYTENVSLPLLSFVLQSFYTMTPEGLARAFSILTTPKSVLYIWHTLEKCLLK